MNIKQAGTAILLKDAVNDASNAGAQAFAKTVISGAAPLTAPFIGMDKPWTQEKIDEFNAVLSQYEED